MFLAGETRQVWALRRDDLTPVFLPEGEANSMRVFAREGLRCLYPGCESRLSTRGGTKRDHFFHVDPVSHETGREGENHLAAKAMLAEWLRGRVPTGTTVLEEQTVKNSGSAMHRRPDVLATGATGRRMAFEIEYKPWAIESWRKKQGDFDDEDISCLWLLGHTRVRLSPAVDFANALVRVPALAAAIARRGLPLLVVNPATQEVGTLTRDGAPVRYDGESRMAYLHVDRLEDCTFSSLWGIRTPTMTRLDHIERERALAAARRAQHLADQEARIAALRAKEMEAQRVRTEEHLRRLQSEWASSPILTILRERWQEVPRAFGSTVSATEGIDAIEAFWRAVLFINLIEGHEGAKFRFGNAIAVLSRAGIQVQGISGERAIHDFLMRLAHSGVLKFAPRTRFTSPGLAWVPTGMPLGAAWDDSAPSDYERNRLLATQAQGQAPIEKRETFEQHLDARRRTKQVTLADGTKAWVRKRPGE